MKHCSICGKVEVDKKRTCDDCAHIYGLIQKYVYGKADLQKAIAKYAQILWILSQVDTKESAFTNTKRIKNGALAPKNKVTK